jgi:hypothetical protein
MLCRWGQSSSAGRGSGRIGPGTKEQCHPKMSLGRKKRPKMRNGSGNLSRFKRWRRGRDSNPRADYSARRFRGAPVTTTSVPLLIHFARSQAPRCALAVAAARRLPSGARLRPRAISMIGNYRLLSAKNAWIKSRQSASITRPVTSRRWFSDGCSWARIADSIAPAFGSGVP